MSAAHSADVDLDDVIAEITIDCFNEDEQLQAFENAFDEHPEFPCPGSHIAPVAPTGALRVVLDSEDARHAR